ncbi:hypothetical protein ZHAS_00010847 [Anopheles sinensis]|uniref:Uncharacterized protein n=1 Tax=Anopheles sinensis TaxID=74873 RepID=A0A084VYC8_ANOSI|nr:hypothetical protein ZHAS_00010847 [Anopheles sinensis]
MSMKSRKAILIYDPTASEPTNRVGLAGRNRSGKPVEIPSEWTCESDAKEFTPKLLPRMYRLYRPEVICLSVRRVGQVGQGTDTIWMRDRISDGSIGSKGVGRESKNE